MSFHLQHEFSCINKRVFTLLLWTLAFAKITAFLKWHSQGSHHIEVVLWRSQLSPGYLDRKPASFKAMLKKDSVFLTVRSPWCKQVRTEQDPARWHTYATNCGGHRDNSDPTCSTSYKPAQRFSSHTSIFKGCFPDHCQLNSLCSYSSHLLPVHPLPCSPCGAAVRLSSGP